MRLLLIFLLGFCLLLMQCTQPKYQVCTTDADCSNDETCVAAACIKRSEEKTCPFSCRAHNDCQNCPAEQRSCVKGVCTFPPLCPATCSGHRECSSCLNGATSCIAGSCQAPVSCPDSCAKDVDCFSCGDGKVACLSSVCARPECPVRCSGDLDCGRCDKQKTFCLRAKCQKKPASCPSQCFLDDDCAGCGAGKKHCVAGACQTPQCQTDNKCPAHQKCVWKACVKTPTVGQTCTKGQCPKGFVCDTRLNICFEDCSQDEELCLKNTKDGRTLCVLAVVKDNVRYPVCLSSAKEGELCQGASYNTPHQGYCDPYVFPPLHCNRFGFCERAILQTKAGDLCSRRNDTTEPIRVCDEKSSSPLACDERSDIPRCVTATPVSHGQICDPQGTLGNPAVCTESTFCIQFHPPYSIGRCLQKCNPKKQDSLCTFKGEVCRPLSGSTELGVCLQQNCEENDDCHIKGFQCFSGFCYPPVPEGKAGYGDICGHSVCKKDLVCLGSSRIGKGYCSQVCSARKTCPPFPKAGGGFYRTICGDWGNGTKLCSIVCQDTKKSTDCPIQMRCIPVTNDRKRGICLASSSSQ